LKAVVADAEWRERGRSCGCTQDAMTGFTAIPCPYYLFFLFVSVVPVIRLSIDATACRHARRQLAMRMGQTFDTQVTRSICSLSNPPREGVGEPPLALPARRAHSGPGRGLIRQGPGDRAIAASARMSIRGLGPEMSRAMRGSWVMRSFGR
jgi:hypothetical protein